MSSFSFRNNWFAATNGGSVNHRVIIDDIAARRHFCTLTHARGNDFVVHELWLKHNCLVDVVKTFLDSGGRQIKDISRGNWRFWNIFKQIDFGWHLDQILFVVLLVYVATNEQFSEVDNASINCQSQHDVDQTKCSIVDFVRQFCNGFVAYFCLLNLHILMFECNTWVSHANTQDTMVGHAINGKQVKMLHHSDGFNDLLCCRANNVRSFGYGMQCHISIIVRVSAVPNQQ